MPNTMRYTTDKPEAAGFYFLCYKDRSSHFVELVVDVYPWDKEMFADVPCVLDGVEVVKEVNVKNITGLWAGPIEMPPLEGMDEDWLLARPSQVF